MFFISPKFICCNLIYNVMVSGDEPLGDGDGSPMRGLVSLQKKTLVNSLLFLSCWENPRQPTITQEEDHNRHQIFWYLDLELPHLQNCEE